MELKKPKPNYGISQKSVRLLVLSVSLNRILLYR